jgi:ankyrin repeat protein
MTAIIVPGKMARFAGLLLSALLFAACSDDPRQAEKAERPATLFDAAEQGDLMALDEFLVGRQWVNSRTACQWTPLMKAALNGHPEAVRKLLDKGAQVELVDKGGYSAMMLAASNGFVEVVRILLDHGAEVDRVEQTQGMTALIWAAQRGHPETVRLLLERGADAALRDREGKTARDRAEEAGHQAVVRLLDQYRARPVNGE